MNYYPPCPKANKVLGLTPHLDATRLTLLVQVNEVQGLQIKKNSKWVPIKSLPGSIIVNIGDVIEYRSIEHTAVVNYENERLSISAFHSVTYIQDDDILMSGIDKNGDLIHGEKEIEVESDDAYDFYNEYGLSKGFGIRKSYHNKHSVTKEIYQHVFVCNKEGYKDMNDKRTTDNVKRRCIKRTRCNAMIRVKLSNDENWVVEKFIDEHNHPFNIPSHVKTSQITKILNACRGNHEDKLTKVQCSTIVSGERRRNLGKECHGVIMHFKDRAEVDTDFYFAMDSSTDGTLRNVFWAGGSFGTEMERVFTHMPLPIRLVYEFSLLDLVQNYSYLKMKEAKANNRVEVPLEEIDMKNLYPSKGVLINTDVSIAAKGVDVLVDRCALVSLVASTTCLETAGVSSILLLVELDIGAENNAI
ncbi:protein FAR1-related sequence 5 [Tanacetum coccineum]